MTKFKSHKPKIDHDAFYQDFVALLNKHTGKLPSDEMLAIAANALGKIIAMQDQRKYTPAEIMDLAAKNIEDGNQQMIDQLTKQTGGTA